MKKIFEKLLQKKKTKQIPKHKIEEGYIFLGRGRKINETSQKQFIKITDADLSTHMHVLGATGSGKTVFLTYLDYQFLYNNYSLLKLDMKFDMQNFTVLYYVAKKLNKPFFMLNISFHAGTGTLSSFGTHSYNPLEIGDELSITAKIMQANKSSSSVSYYEEVKETTVKAFVSAFLSTGKPWTFRDWYATLIDYEMLKELIYMSRNELANSYLMNLHERLTDDKKRMQAEKDISGLRNFVAKMSDYDFLNSYRSDVNLEKIIFANAVLYVVLPKLLFGEVAKSIGKMIASDMQYLAGFLAANIQRTKVVISIDEFENFIFDGIQDLFNKGRSAGIRMIASHQSLSDISHEEKETMKKIIQANTRIKVFLSQADTESAIWFSELVGKKPVISSINIDGISISENHNYIVEPHMLTSLKNFHAFFYIKGEPFVGHIYAIPSDIELGKDIEYPNFSPTLDRKNGIRLWEKYLEKKQQII